MDKDEILEKSRKENNGTYDEQEKNIVVKGNAIGMAVGILACSVLYLIERNIVYFMIWFSMFLVSNLYTAIKTKKVIYIFLTIIMGIALALMLAVYLSDRGVF